MMQCQAKSDNLAQILGYQIWAVTSVLREPKLLHVDPNLHHRCILLVLNDIALSSLMFEAYNFVLPCSRLVMMSDGAV